MKCRRQEMQADGKPLRILTTGNARSWKSRKIGGDRKNIVEVHFQRVFGLFSQLEGRRRAHGAGDQVDLFECVGKVVLDQSSHLASLAIVGIRIASRQSKRP